MHSYNKDGAMTYRHAGSQPVYAPNSYGGPQADPARSCRRWSVEAGEIGRYAYEPHADDDDFVQPRQRSTATSWSDTDREHLVDEHRRPRERRGLGPVQERVVDYWTNVDAELGARVAAGLGHALPVLD